MPSLGLGLAAACLLLLAAEAQSPTGGQAPSSGGNMMEGHATEYGSTRVSIGAVCRLNMQ